MDTLHSALIPSTAVLSLAWSTAAGRALAEVREAARVGLDNRELASLIWIAIALIALIAYRPTRRSVRNVASAAMTPKIVVPVVGLAAWSVGLVVWAQNLGLWTSDLVYDAVMWFFAVALIALIGAATSKEGTAFVKRTAVQAVEVGVLLEFYVNFAVLPLTLELLLQPLVLILVVTYHHSRTRPELAESRRAVGWLLLVLGLAIGAWVAYRTAVSLPKIDVGLSIRELILPVWLTGGVLPFVFAFALYSEYEQAFIRLDLVSENRDPAPSFVKLALVLGLHVRLSDVSRLSHSWLFDLARADSFSSAHNLVRKFRQSRE